jgi:hypothetical protein
VGAGIAPCVCVQAQQRISGLELQTTVSSPELQQLGLQIELDKATGKLEVGTFSACHEPLGTRHDSSPPLLD